VVWPSVIKQVDPEYRPDGHTDNIAVTKSLDKEHGLDDEAVKAAQQWLFEPCKKDGKAVRCNVQIELEFRLDRRR